MVLDKKLLKRLEDIEACPRKKKIRSTISSTWPSLTTKQKRPSLIKKAVDLFAKRLSK